MGLSFTNEETELLLHLYEEKGDILRNRDKTVEAKAKRDEAWKEIHQQIVTQTGKNFSIQQCKKRYNNKKQALREKFITARLNMNRNCGDPLNSELMSGTDLFFNFGNEKGGTALSGPTISSIGTANLYSKRDFDISDACLKKESDVSNTCLKRKLDDFESSSEDNACVKLELGAKVPRNSIGDEYNESANKSKDSGIPLGDLKRQVLLRQLDLFDKQEEVLQKISAAADSIASIKNAIELASAAIFEHYQQTD